MTVQRVGRSHLVAYGVLLVVFAACVERPSIPQIPTGSPVAISSAPAPGSQVPADGAATASLQEVPPASPLDSLEGTTWVVTAIGGQPVLGDERPRIEFELFGRPGNTGDTGCDEFGFDTHLDGSSIAVDHFILAPFDCKDQGADVEKAFLAALDAVETWSAEGDVLNMSGPRGAIAFVRDVPPPGDPGRIVVDLLRQGQWRVLRAPGVDADALPPMTIGDTVFAAGGECGFSGRLHFGRNGEVRFTEVGWDTTGCPGAQDTRLALQRVLEGVTRGRTAPNGTVILAGPFGEVVLGR